MNDGPEVSRKFTWVLGASPRPQRYSYLAVERLVQNGHPVTAIGLRSAMIGTTPIITDAPIGSHPHTITLYLSAKNQRAWEDVIMSERPSRIIFNPGAENLQLAERAKKAGIEVVNGCTLVMLNIGAY